MAFCSSHGATVSLLCVSYTELVETPNIYGIHDCLAVTAEEKSEYSEEDHKIFKRTEVFSSGHAKP